MKALKTILLLAAVALTSTGLGAQGITDTPYSRFGYGVLRDNATSAQQGMGGVGYAMSSGRQINVMNPASYARMDSLTFLFDMGIGLTSLNTSETDPEGKKISENNFGGGLNYITMQFPVSKRIGMSLGILPFSGVGYSFGNKIDNGTTQRGGSGSINEVYIGIAGRIVGGLNVGVNVSYLFGSTVNDTYAVANTGSTSLFENELSVRDYRIQAGLQYTQQIGRDQWTLGATFTPGKALLGNIRTYAYDIDQKEELHSRYKTKDLYSLAATYGVGINYLHDERLMIEGDFTYQPWAKAKYDGEKDVLNNRYKIALGAQWQPAPRGGYFRRIQYRAGAYWNHDYLKVRGNGVREYGASIGFGLPVPGFKSVFNIGIGYMHRQASPQALIKENYLQINIGINFNEMWFRKSKLN